MPAVAVSTENGVIWGTEDATDVAVICYGIETEPNILSIEFPGNIGQTKSITDIKNGMDGVMRLQLKENVTYPAHLEVIGVKPKGDESAAILVQVVGDPVVRRFNDRRPFVEVHFRQREDITLTET